jgi:ribosome-binding factor A
VTRFKRADRVGGQIQKELSVLLRKEIRDPRLESVTILRVALSDDLRSARVYFSVAEGEEHKINALAGFKSASGYFRRKLGNCLELRYVPELRFLYDESFERATKVDRLLKTIREEEKTAETE